MKDDEMINALTIDVEDYFHVSAFESVSAPDSWDGRELRVERNTEKILAILDETGVKATFFVLGWVALKLPQLVRDIAARGHEVASHGFGHRRICFLGQKEFREDIRRSKTILEDLTGCAVQGYRAPSYSISAETPWAFDELWAADFRYDSSVFPVRHDFYGLTDWPRFQGRAVRFENGTWGPAADAAPGQASLMEVPISTLEFGSQRVPIAGGGYFRLYPYNFTRWGLRRINRIDRRPFIFYLHPWEIDPDQPRLRGAGLKSTFRHYLNLHRTETRFRRLVQDFHFAPVAEGLKGWTA